MVNVLLRLALRAAASALVGLFPLLGLIGCSRDEPALWKRVDGRWTYDGQPFEAADPASLKPIDGRFARDAKQAYYRGTPVPGSDAASFEVMGENVARDRHSVYWADTYRKAQEYWSVRHVRVEPMPEADPARYRLLKYGYGSDGERAYKEGQRLRGVREPASFEVLTPRLARDSRRGYFEDIEIPDSDGASFQIIDAHDDAWVRDRQRAWHVRYGQPGTGEPARREVRLLAGADAPALRPLGREYASDGRRVWWRGQALAAADAASFAVIEDAPAAASGAVPSAEAADARDAHGRYRRGRRMGAGS